MKDRLKRLRSVLGITQKELATAIGMKQNTIATYEMGRAIPSNATINRICKEYHVNEEWFRNGGDDTEMFLQDETTTIDRLCKEKNASELERQILILYFQLESTVRDKIIVTLLEVLLKNVDFAGKGNLSEDVKALSAQILRTTEAEALYESSLRTARKPEQPALNTSDGTSKAV